MADKLYKEHQAAEKKAQRATADYERGIRQTGKAKEPDDAGNKAAQSGPVKRALRGSK